MPKMRILESFRFHPPGRAEIACMPGDFIFLDADQAARFEAEGLVQDAALPYPPAAPPPASKRPLLYDGAGRPIQEEERCES